MRSRNPTTQFEAEGRRWHPIKKLALRIGYAIPFISGYAAAGNSVNPGLGRTFEPLTHSSSVLTGYSIGALAMIATAEVSNYLDEKGWQRAACRLQKVGEYLACVSSLTYQWAAESNTFAIMGNGQRSDFIYGALATAPGVLFGACFAREGLGIPSPSGSSEHAPRR